MICQKPRGILWSPYMYLLPFAFFLWRLKGSKVFFLSLGQFLVFYIELILHA